MLPTHKHYIYVCKKVHVEPLSGKWKITIKKTRCYNDASIMGLFLGLLYGLSGLDGCLLFK